MPFHRNLNQLGNDPLVMVNLDGTLAQASTPGKTEIRGTSCNLELLRIALADLLLCVMKLVQQEKLRSAAPPAASSCSESLADLLLCIMNSITIPHVYSLPRPRAHLDSNSDRVAQVS